MVKIYSMIPKVVVIGTLIAIPVVYFAISNWTLEAVVNGYEENANIYEKHKFKDIAKFHEDSEIEKPTDKDTSSENNFCREFKSKGLITRREGERKPGMLREVSEAAVADNSIFFLETSCAIDLNPRQSCAVESAARANPEKQVYVMLISPEASDESERKYNIGKIKSIYTNVHFYYIDLVNYTKGTKMEEWVKNQTLSKSSFKVAHLSDGLRLLTLCKYGGVYFDMDVVVIHSFQNMSNFVGDEGYGRPANGVMSMKANGTLVNACLDEFVDNFRGDLWSHNGPEAVTRALQKICKRNTTELWENCDGTFVLYPRKKFYPIHWTEWKLYFEDTNNEKIAEIEKNSLAVHVWNRLSSQKSVKVGSNVLYGVLASKYCPLSYWNAGQFF